MNSRAPKGYHKDSSGNARISSSLYSKRKASKRLFRRSRMERCGDYYSNLAVSNQKAVESRRVHEKVTRKHATRWEELAITQVRSLWRALTD